MLKNMIHKPEKPLQQIARRYGKIKTACSNYNKSTNDNLELVATSLHVKVLYLRTVLIHSIKL